MVKSGQGRLSSRKKKKGIDTMQADFADTLSLAPCKLEGGAPVTILGLLTKVQVLNMSKGMSKGRFQVQLSLK